MRQLLTILALALALAAPAAAKQFDVNNASQVTASSGNQANANAVATITSNTQVTAWLSGFTCTAAGATGALVVNATVTGLVGGTQTYSFTFPAGVTVGAVPLQVSFASPMPATGTNVNIVVTLPASGAGGTNAACVAWGYLL